MGTVDDLLDVLMEYVIGLYNISVTMINCEDFADEYTPEAIFSSMKTFRKLFHNLGQIIDLFLFFDCSDITGELHVHLHFRKGLLQSSQAFNYCRNSMGKSAASPCHTCYLCM